MMGMKTVCPMQGGPGLRNPEGDRDRVRRMTGQMLEDTEAVGRILAPTVGEKGATTGF